PRVRAARDARQGARDPARALGARFLEAAPRGGVPSAEGGRGGARSPSIGGVLGGRQPPLDGRGRRRRANVSERIAFVSDLHSNLEALDAVLKDIESKKVKRIICLGDLVGYGPNPLEVLDVARRAFDVVIEGNHDEAVGARVPRAFKRIAARSAVWTRRVVKP